MEVLESVNQWYHLLSIKKAPVASLSLSCLPDKSDVKNVSPAGSRVVEEVANVS